MRYLNDKIFEDLMDRFKWYPKSFTLNIFCRNTKSAQIFKRKIDSMHLNFNKIKSSNCIIYENGNKCLRIFEVEPCSITKIGRANAIIFDASYSFIDVDTIIIPLANIEPSYGAISFNEFTLEKDLKGIRILPDYKIDLEDNQ